MTGKDMIAMSQGDLRRLAVIHKAIDKRVTQVEAAGMLDLSDRQIRRMIVRVQEDGDKGIIHASRGQPSHNAKDLKIKNRAINLYRGRFFALKNFFPGFCRVLDRLGSEAVTDQSGTPLGGGSPMARPGPKIF